MIGLILCERKFIMVRNGVHITGITVKRIFFTRSFFFYTLWSGTIRKKHIKILKNVIPMQFKNENDIKVNEYLRKLYYLPDLHANSCSVHSPSFRVFLICDLQWFGSSSDWSGQSTLWSHRHNLEIQWIPKFQSSSFDILDLWLPDLINSITYNLFFLCHYEFKNLS